MFCQQTNEASIELWSLILTVIVVVIFLGYIFIKCLLLMWWDVHQLPKIRGATADKLLPKVYDNAAEKAVNAAKALGLNLDYDSGTLGDGNCFYHAVLEQVYTRPEVMEAFLQRHAADPFVIKNHSTLRKALVKYTKKHVHRKTVGVSRREWKEYLESQATNGIHVQEAVQNMMSDFLGVRVILIMVEKNGNMCKLDFSSNATNRPILYLGYIDGDHYQALYDVQQPRRRRYI